MSEKKEKKEIIIGIDLGTSNSAAAVMIGGKPEIIPSAEGLTIGGKAFPSYVALTKDGIRLVGEPARRQAITNPQNTVRAIKRKMGTDYRVKLGDKEYSPEEISAMILSKIKQDAESYLGQEIKSAVITVPAYFNDAQRTATKNAGRIAGLEVKRIINEPTAACLAYGLDKLKQQSLKIAVLDLGGGTFDVTIMEMGGGVFTVLSTSGDTQLGGTDMDKILFNYVVNEFKKQYNIDLAKDKTAEARILEAVEKAKIELSSLFSTTINLPFIATSEEGPLNLEMEITRAKLEELITPVLNRLIPPIDQAVKDANLSSSTIDKIILVGGPTRMPSVRQKFKSYFGKEPERTVDPMECVALGASIQGAVLAGTIEEDILLLDVTPLTLSIETLGGVATPLIERNTTIPVERAKVFSTASDNQPGVEINVLQGERPMAADNFSLGKFHLTGIPPAPRGVPQIEVKFSIDANGILKVTAKDLGTGKEASITITDSQGLSEEEVKRKIKEAEEYKEKDKERFEKVKIRNESEQLIIENKKMMEEYAKFIDDELKNKLISASDDLQRELDANNIQGMKVKKEALEKAMQELGSKIYAEQMKNQQGGAGAQGFPGGAGGFPGGMGGFPGGADGFPGGMGGFPGGMGGQPGTSEADDDRARKKKEKKREAINVDWEDEEDTK